MSRPYTLSPWRIMVLIVIGPAAVVATAILLRVGHPDLFAYEWTDDGVRVVHWAPSPADDAAMARAAWCQSVDAPTSSPTLAAHVEGLRASARYDVWCS